MSREETISIMNVIVHMLEPQYDMDRIEEAVEMAIKALEQQPTDAVDRVTIKEYLESFGKDTNVSATDCISRQAILDAIDRIYPNALYNRAAYAELCNVVVNSPSVTPQPKMGSSSENPNKRGKWRHYEGMLYCSRCGAEFYDEIMEYTGDEVPKYCPQCGQPKMQEVEE